MLLFIKLGRTITGYFKQSQNKVDLDSCLQWLCTSSKINDKIIPTIQWLCFIFSFKFCILLVWLAFVK